MIRQCVLSTVIAGLAATPLSGSTHHSLEEMYDLNSSIELTGLVTLFSWANPHAVFALEVEDEQGTIVPWIVEMAPPSALMRRGVSQDMIRDGQEVSVEGNPGLDGVTRMNATTLTLPSGETLNVEGGNWVPIGD